MTLERYEEFVREKFHDAARDRARIVFTNRGPAHAHAVMSEMMSRATERLDMVSGCLRDTVFDAEILREVCSRVPVRLIVTDDVPLRGPSALVYLRRDVPVNHLEVRHLGAGVHTPHFAISDGKHIRSEQDQVERTAIIVLNADVPEADGLASQYAKFFESLWASATKIDLDVIAR